MDKRERKSRLKDIIKDIDKTIGWLETDAKKTIKTIQGKIDDLSWCLEMNCLMPDSFDTDEMMKDILVEYFDYDEDIIEIKGGIDSLREDVYGHIEEMKDGSNKEEWEEFYSNLEYVEDIIDIKEQEITDVEDFIENMKELKNRLEDLV